jgi:hypothetical protein
VKDTSSNAQGASQTKDTSSQANDASSQANNASGQAGDASSQTNGASAQVNSESSQGNGAPAQMNGVSSPANDTAAQTNNASAQTNGASAQTNDTAAQANDAAAQANSKPAPVANMLAAQPSTHTVHTGSGDFTIPGTAYLQNRPSTTGLDGSVVPVASEPFGSTDASSCTLPPGAAVLLLDSRTAGDGRLAFQVQNRECSGWVDESLLSSAPVNLGNVDPGTQDIWQPGK